MYDLKKTALQLFYEVESAFSTQDLKDTHNEFYGGRNFCLFTRKVHRAPFK